MILNPFFWLSESFWEFSELILIWNQFSSLNRLFFLYFTYQFSFLCVLFYMDTFGDFHVFFTPTSHTPGQFSVFLRLPSFYFRLFLCNFATLGKTNNGAAYARLILDNTLEPYFFTIFLSCVLFKKQLVKIRDIIFNVKQNSAIMP